MSAEDAARYNAHWDSLENGTYNLPDMNAEDFSRFQYGIDRLDSFYADRILADSADDILKIRNNGDVFSNIDNSFITGMSAEDAARYDRFWDEVKNGIDVDTRVKINNWDYTPGSELYLKYKDVYDNPKYYNQITGEINWPNSDGFKDNYIEQIMSKNAIFKRYGGEAGEFLGNATDSFESRSLAPHSDPALTNTEIHYYKLIENIKMATGEAAPWFGSDGGAEQFVKYKPDGSKYTIREMLDEGILEDITDLIENGDVRND